MTDIPIVIGPEGLQPEAPAAINTQLINTVAANQPGYTANLPGSLIEDISSTDTYAIVECDQALVEAVNSMTPYGANVFVLTQLGNMLGVPEGEETNTSVYVVFSGNSTSIGLVTPAGTQVEDTAGNTYTLPDGGIIGANQSSAPLFAVANNAGSFPVPIGTVTTIGSSFPPGYALVVTNLVTGIPSAGAQTEEGYRAAVLQANLASAQGMGRFLKTLLGNVAGVQSRLISVRQGASSGWEIIVGGGDPYQVANAIYQALFDISTLVGSTLEVTGITNATNGEVSTNLNHGYSATQAIEINGVVGMSGVNGVATTVVAVIDEKHFTIGINTTSSGAYGSGGVVTPNLRNETVNIFDTPDTYSITFVQPPQQTVTIDLTWNTDSPNFVNPAAVQQLGAPALVDYINSISVGQPINEFTLQTTFTAAIASAVAPELVSRMVFVVSINGVSTSPTSGTGLIEGDPESFFFAEVSGITIVQG